MALYKKYDNQPKNDPLRGHIPDDRILPKGNAGAKNRVITRIGAEEEDKQRLEYASQFEKTKRVALFHPLNR